MREQEVQAEAPEMPHLAPIGFTEFTMIADHGVEAHFVDLGDDARRKQGAVRGQSHLADRDGGPEQSRLNRLDRIPVKQRLAAPIAEQIDGSVSQKGDDLLDKRVCVPLLPDGGGGFRRLEAIGAFEVACVAKKDVQLHHATVSACSANPVTCRNPALTLNVSPGRFQGAATRKDPLPPTMGTRSRGRWPPVVSM